MVGISVVSFEISRIAICDIVTIVAHFCDGCGSSFDTLWLIYFTLYALKRISLLFPWSSKITKLCFCRPYIKASASVGVQSSL